MKHFISIIVIAALSFTITGCINQTPSKPRSMDEVLSSTCKTYKGTISLPADNDADYIAPFFIPATPLPPQNGVSYPQDNDAVYQYPYPVYQDYETYKKQMEEKKKNRVFNKPLFY